LTEVKEKDITNEAPVVPEKKELNNKKSFSIEGYIPKIDGSSKKSKISETKFLIEEKKQQTKIENQPSIIIENQNENQFEENDPPRSKLRQNEKTKFLFEANIQTKKFQSDENNSQKSKLKQQQTKFEENHQPKNIFQFSEINPQKPKPNENQQLSIHQPEVLYESDSELNSSMEEDIDNLQPKTVPTLADLEVSNFGYVWNALMGWVTQETIFYCNALPLPKPPSTNPKNPDDIQLSELVFPPIDSISIDSARRGTFNQLIQSHVNDINAKLKLSVPIYGEFQGCVNTFLFRSTIDVFTSAQWGTIALAIIVSLKKRNICEDFVPKLEQNLLDLSNEYGMSQEEISIISALLTGEDK